MILRGYLGEVRVASLGGDAMQAWADLRHVARHRGLQPTISCLIQSTSGLFGNPGVSQDYRRLGRVDQVELDLLLVITQNSELEGYCGVNDLVDVLAIY